jgi:hypothetical protein
LSLKVKILPLILSKALQFGLLVRHDISTIGFQKLFTAKKWKLKIAEPNWKHILAKTAKLCFHSQLSLQP